MGIMEKYKGSSNERIGEGTYPVRICQIIDLGLQEDEWKGETKIVEKIWITFEFPTEFITYEKDGEMVTKPRRLSGEFTKSTGEKARLTPVIKSTDPKAESFKDLLGLPLLVQVGTTSGGKDKYIGASPLPKGMTVAPLQNEVKYFDLEHPDDSVFNGLPEFLKEKIISSKSYTPF